jgi:hypothetical protein
VVVVGWQEYQNWKSFERIVAAAAPVSMQNVTPVMSRRPAGMHSSGTCVLLRPHDCCHSQHPVECMVWVSSEDVLCLGSPGVPCAWQKASHVVEDSFIGRASWIPDT